MTTPPAETPDEWLLRRFDTVGRRYSSIYTRRMFDLLDDHPGDECRPDPDRPDRCEWLSGAATWPTTPAPTLERQTA